MTGEMETAMSSTDIIIIDTYPDTKVKVDILSDLIDDFRSHVDYPIALVSHIPIPSEILDKVDYHIYDRHNPLSHDYYIKYHYIVPGDLKLVTPRKGDYHSLACYTSIRNAMSLFRNRYMYAHFFEWDTMVDVSKYFEAVKQHLDTYHFIGHKFNFPFSAKMFSGIITNYFSCDIAWMDTHLLDIRNWDYYVSRGLGDDDNLMLESWLYNYFDQRSMLPFCYFGADIPIKPNIGTRKDSEPLLVAELSETDDHRLMLFLRLEDYSGRSLKVNIYREFFNSEYGFLQSIPPGTVVWFLIDKQGIINIWSDEQRIEFTIDPSKTYTDTMFRFYDDKYKCLAWEEPWNIGFKEGKNENR